MQSRLRFAEPNGSTLKHLGPYGWIPLLFGVWLLLSVLTPEEVYRTFFHALIYPLTIYVLVRKGERGVWNDPFIRLFLFFCVYMATTTWLVGSDPADNDLQAARWGFEAGLGMIAYFLWIRAVVLRDQLWGRWFLLLALLGSSAGLLWFLPEAFLGARIGGLGAMEHPIQGSSIAIILLALGLFLTCVERKVSSWTDLSLAVAAAVSVSIFVILSQSRGPLIALVLYLSFFAIMLSFQYRRLTIVYASLIIAVAVLGLVHWFMGLGVLAEQLMSRGGSYRLEIWTAYLTHLPGSLLLGNGAGLDFDLTNAARLSLEPMGLHIEHPHNLWIGVFVETGLIGVVLQAGLVILPTMAAIRSRLTLTQKLQLLAILGLFFLLTFSDEYTLLISLHPVWFYGWLPLIFVWIWSRYKANECETKIDYGAGGRK